MILLDRVTKTYPGDERPALDNVSLHIDAHEFVFLVGKSGAGKSTLIKMIIKEERPDSGKIIIGGIDLDYVKKRHIPHYRRRLGVVFQDLKLLPTRTVFENVSFALEIAGVSNREILRTVPKVLDLVGLADKANKFPVHLSGGEKQRVSIARSVARQPKILIADEPTGSLDKLTRREIVDLLQKINDFGTTLLVTTHDENIVNDLRKRVITLKDGQIVEDQKNGIYRLDSAPEPEVEVVQHIFAPGAQIITGRQRVVAAPGHAAAAAAPVASKAPAKTAAKSSKAAPETALKISHTNRKKPTPITKPTKNAAKSPAKTPTPAKTAAAAKAPAKKLAQDAANQWYTASRPLRAAPKLSDFSLGQTVKLKPAPSMSQAVKRKPTIPKVKQKRVI